jgi:hypothetical protein
LRAKLSYRKGVSGERWRSCLEHIRPIAFITKHHSIDTTLLQRCDIFRGAVDDLLHAALRVIEWRTRQGQKMHHSDDRLVASERILEHGSGLWLFTGRAGQRARGSGIEYLDLC